MEFDFHCTLSIAPRLCVSHLPLSHSKQVSMVCIFSQEMTACLWVYVHACVSYLWSVTAFQTQLLSHCALCVSPPPGQPCAFEATNRPSARMSNTRHHSVLSFSLSLSAHVLSTYSAGTVYLYTHMHTKTHELCSKTWASCLFMQHFKISMGCSQCEACSKRWALYFLIGTFF